MPERSLAERLHLQGVVSLHHEGVLKGCIRKPRLSPRGHGAGGACEARTDGVQRHLGQGHPEVVAVGRRRGLLLGLQLAQGRCSLGATVGQEGQEGEQREGLPASGLKGP